MEDVKDECPTEILIELKEDSYKPLLVNPNDFQNLLDDRKLNSCLKNEEHYFPLMRQSEDCKPILDMSPFRIKEKLCSTNSRTDFEAIQDSKMDVNSDDCPTGILVDLPHNLHSPSKANFFRNTLCSKAASKMTRLEVSIIKDADSEEETCLNSGIKNCRLTDNSDDDCSKSDEEKSKSSASKFSFKTPSPQTMSLIRSEVSKVINNLNSSVVFDEDDLLNEEMLPLHLNFDIYDLDDVSDMDKQLPKQKEACKSEITDCKVSISVQTHDSSDKSDGITVNNVIFHHDFNGILKVSSESSDSQSSLSGEVGCSPLYSYSTEIITSEENSEENRSCDIKSDSLDMSNISDFYNSTDDNFVMTCAADEDKENAQGNNEVLPKKTPKRCKFLQKKSFISKKTESRETLKNLSNINLKPTNKDSSLRVCQQNKPKTPQIKMSTNSKVLQPPSSKKLQLKKTVSDMESGIASKRISLSNSFHFQSSKEFISSLQKPCFMDQNTTFYPNPAYKSYMKQENQDKRKNCFTTPSKRYSISTPLKGTVPKPQFTPSLQGSQNYTLPRFTPQAVRGSHLSFSKSLQCSSKISNFSMKQQSSVSSVSSRLSQPFVARYNSSKPVKSVVQGICILDGKISEKKALSTSNVKRFHSKLSLPSPLSTAQDKNLARALFPSIP